MNLNSKWCVSIFCTVVVSLLTAACDSPQPTAVVCDSEKPESLAFVDVNVISMVKLDEVLENRTVLVSNGHIQNIFDSDDKLPDCTKKIEAKGMYLMPGLSDMHVHLGSADELPLYIANGVTQIRNMWGDEETLALRKRIEEGDLLGPRILTAGPIVDGKPKVWPGSLEVVTKEDAVKVVSSQKAAGYDFIKVYSRVSLEAFDAIAKAAAAQDIAFAGHVPLKVPVSHALTSGISTIEHLYGMKKATVHDGVSLGETIIAKEKIELGKKLLSGELESDDIFDRVKMLGLVDLSIKNNVTNVPTLIAMRNFSLNRDEINEQLKRDELKFLSPAIINFWNPKNDFRRKSMDDEDFNALQAFSHGDLERVKMLQDGGARILTGTDSPNPFVLPGFSIHEELALFVSAGLTPYEALMASTKNVSDFLDGAEASGIVSVGARADLVLLAENPLKNISSTKSIKGVLVKGQWLDHIALEGLLRDIQEAHAKASSVTKTSEEK